MNYLTLTLMLPQWRGGRGVKLASHDMTLLFLSNYLQLWMKYCKFKIIIFERLKRNFTKIKGIATKKKEPFFEAPFKLF